jgi:hypothetical protein
MKQDVFGRYATNSYFFDLFTIKAGCVYYIAQASSSKVFFFIFAKTCIQFGISNCCFSQKLTKILLIIVAVVKMINLG